MPAWSFSGGADFSSTFCLFLRPNPFQRNGFGRFELKSSTGKGARTPFRRVQQGLGASGAISLPGAPSRASSRPESPSGYKHPASSHCAFLARLGALEAISLPAAPSRANSRPGSPISHKHPASSNRAYLAYLSAGPSGHQGCNLAAQRPCWPCCLSIAGPISGQRQVQPRRVQTQCQAVTGFSGYCVPVLNAEWQGGFLDV